MLELVSNKKYVAHNVTPEGEFTCFCKYSMLSNGNLIVDYFMPKQGFSLLWSIPNDHKTILLGVTETMDGRSTKVRFAIHPSYYSGNDFRDLYITNIYGAMDEVFTERLKYLDKDKYFKKF